MGTRRIVDDTWLSPRIDQNVRLLRRISTVGLLSGMRHFPSFSTRAG